MYTYRLPLHLELTLNQTLEIEDLEMITKDRKSTKKNPEGPIIYGAKSPWGKPKVGHSIPQHLKNNLDH